MTNQKLAYDRGSDLYGIAFALGAIGNLLGADASEHYLNDEDAEGLAHAVVAIGQLVKLIGGEFCEAFAPCESGHSAPQNEAQPNRSAAGEGDQ
jgi:hypothetical protein